MSAPLPRVFVVTVHYGHPAHTDRAVAALLASTAPPRLVAVVDHAEVPYLWAGPADRVEVVRPPTNGGCAAGLNAGLRRVTALGAEPADVAVCMNNDITVSPDAVARLQMWWAGRLRPGLVNAEVAYPGGSVTAGGRLSWLTGRTEPVYVGGKRRPARYRGPGWRYVDGAFVSADLATWDAVGGWPEHYFLFWEDVLLAERARRNGVPIRTAPGVRVNHGAANSTPGGDKLYYLVRNGADFLEREAPRPWRWLWRPVNRLRHLYHRNLSGADNRHVVARALADARRGVCGRII